MAADLFDHIAREVFIADGGVDDAEEMTDSELQGIVRRELKAWADDRFMVSKVVESFRQGRVTPEVIS